MPSASSHQILERGTVHLKEAGWLGQQQSWLLPAAAVGVLGMLRRGAGTQEVWWQRVSDPTSPALKGAAERHRKF